MLLALLVPLLTAAPAHAANPDRCKTIMRELSSNGSTVKMRYEVWCAVTQDRIIVTADIINQTKGVYSDVKHKDCSDNYFCQLTVTMPDPSGTQQFTGQGVDCSTVGEPDCVTVAFHDGNNTESDEMIPCDQPCPGGLVVRTKHF